MTNNFIFNDNKNVLDGEEISQSTKVYNFPNDSSTLQHSYQPFGTYTATTFTVTFSNDGSGKTATQSVNPFQTIGYAIEEKSTFKERLLSYILL